MKIINYLADILFRHQKKLEIIAIFLLLLTVSFRFTNMRATWLWNDNVYIAVVLALLIIVLALIWTRIEKKKTNDLIALIKKETFSHNTNIKSPLKDLSSRQREVFDLIVEGKSNKEITAVLNIELSTLKTHINQIYKILGIKNRKETKDFDNHTDTT